MTISPDSGLVGGIGGRRPDRMLEKFYLLE
jgi:hypothetical protein